MSVSAQTITRRQELRQRREPIFAVNVNIQHDVREAVDATNQTGALLLIALVSVRAIAHAGLETILALLRAAKDTSAAPLWLEYAAVCP